MTKYQYLLRYPDHDQVFAGEHDGHHVGDRLELNNAEWLVESIVRIRRWEDVERVTLRLAAGPDEAAAAGLSSSGSETCSEQSAC